MTLRLRTLVGLLAAPLPILALAATPAIAANTPTSTAAVRGDVLPALSHSVRTGAIAANRRISVQVSLALRDRAGLAAFLNQVADPKSAQYKHYLTVHQFAARFGATAPTIAKVTAYLTAQGLKVSAPTANHLTLSATGTAAQIEKAFGTRLATFHEARTGRDFFANTAAPQLPAAIASAVLDVSGLNDYARFDSYAAPASMPRAQSHAVTGLTPTKARSAYNLTSTVGAGYNGTGSTVALLEFSAFKQTDITKYDSNFALKPTTPTVVNVSGGTTDLSGEVEDELDIEVVQAIAPGSTIKVYEAPNSDAGEVAVYAQLVSDDVPIISTSWGIDEADETPSNLTAVHADLQEAAAQGQSVYAASGDNGSDDAGNGGTSVDFPASDPSVTGTGGTTLALTSGGAWSAETAWSGSGGGVSSEFATPAYQTPVNSGSHRTVPDVAADADPNSGWAVYSQGSWGEVGGTSAAAPNWAAFTAIYDNEAKAKGKPAFGFANPTIYSLAQSTHYSSAFHDITTGSNGAYSAHAGYDQVTGWGSYNGAGFLSAELG
ncbi:S53 family peptidase [Streptacidiphilus fuscans]|uniref:S8/S53 family peptidase n=1 Tax=Streptacidiphilus fuscans TaxID=2789292 RepID=A0A931B267_9ACTN|nr:S53 family peptidase [Streptacidiphilus fuscans]MBF9069009.1 S8/S53 family peptidase [Streptacidiphilus fuscans]